MRKVVDYRILTEFRDPADRRRLVKALQFVVMEFLKKNPEYELIGGPYVNNNGLECQAVVRYVETVNSCDSYYKLAKETYEWLRSIKKSVDDIWGDEPNEFEGKEL